MSHFVEHIPRHKTPAYKDQPVPLHPRRVHLSMSWQSRTPMNTHVIESSSSMSEQNVTCIKRRVRTGDIHAMWEGGFCGQLQLVYSIRRSPYRHRVLTSGPSPVETIPRSQDSSHYENADTGASPFFYLAASSHSQVVPQALLQACLHQ